MKYIKPKFSLSYSFLKWSALVWMTYDHVLKVIFKIEPGELILFPGRFAFPLFAFMIAYNLSALDIFTKYLKRLLPFTLLTLAVDIAYYPDFSLNIMFTFMISITILWAFKKTESMKDKYARIILLFYIIIVAICLSLFVDYVLFGIWLIPAFYMYFKTHYTYYYLISLALMGVMMPTYLYMAFIILFGALLLLVKPIQSKKHSSCKKTGWMFYAYYPIHKLIIALIAKM
jgi:hypothetical protein